MSAPINDLSGAVSWTGLVATAGALVALAVGLWADVRAAASRARRPRVYWHGRHGLADCLQLPPTRITRLTMPDGSTLEVRQ